MLVLYIYVRRCEKYLLKKIKLILLKKENYVFYYLLTPRWSNGYLFTSNVGSNLQYYMLYCKLFRTSKYKCTAFGCYYTV